MPSSPSSCSPPFPLLSFPFTPPSLPSPFLALPLPLSFLWIASLLILIAYALPCLSYLPPSSHTCSFHIFGGEVLDLALWLSLNTQHRAAHVRHLSGGKRSSKWQNGGECKWCECLYPSMFHISCRKLNIKYGEGMLGYCPHPPSPQLYIHDCT